MSLSVLLAPQANLPAWSMQLLALLLLVLGILANNHNAALALDDLALFADGFYGRSYFHCTASLLHPIDQFLLRQVIRPRVRS